MKNSLAETIFLYENLLSNFQREQIDVFLEGIQLESKSYETSVLWMLDQQIGGIGGYCMPANPVRNPFPSGLERELYRPLQYARSEIDLSDVRIFARHVVHYSGMHLEAVSRFFLKSSRSFGKLRFNNSTLGKATYEIGKMEIFPSGIIEALFKFVNLYNQAKHDINMLEERPRLFSASDAIVCYFGARIIGQVILKELQYSYAFGEHEIYRTLC